MTPAFSLLADGAATPAVSQRLLSLTLSTSSDHASDELSLRLDDRENAIIAPTRGVKLELALGYEDGVLTPQGVFVVDRTDVSGPPDELVVKAKAADMRSALKSPQQKAWRGLTVGDLVAQIAAVHSLMPAVSPSLAGIAIDHRDQTGESDMHFLTRLGRDLGAVAAPKGGRLLFVPKGEELTASGKSLDPITFTRDQLSKFSGVAADRSAYGAVRARYHDKGAAVEKRASSGTGEVTSTLRHLYASQAAAEHAAAAALKHRKLEANKVSFTVVNGAPGLFAGRPVILSGFRAGLEGRWVAAKVDHDVDFAGEGFSTRVDATTTGKSE